ncbi:hypothetical protein B0H10DRAFT_2066575 [Mycena sp. CBHHK59/15]|nr:hypothetical protein B0H10DRAFT_2066575 [Mycena sp. CBHHK59/15]
MDLPRMMTTKVLVACGAERLCIAVLPITVGGLLVWVQCCQGNGHRACRGQNFGTPRKYAAHLPLYGSVYILLHVTAFLHAGTILLHIILIILVCQE